MPEEVVAATPPAGDAAAAAAAAAPDPKALAAEIAALKTQVAEKDEAVRFWHGKAKEGAAAPAPKGAAADETDETDLLDLIGTKGAKGLDDLLAKRGYVKSVDVDAKVNERATQMTREAALVSEYPDLADDSTPFFKDTAKEYGELLKQGMPKALAMQTAAERTELARLRGGGEKTPKGDAAEAERVRRIKAQSGDKTRRPAGGEEPGDELTSDQRTAAAAMGVSEADFKAAQKELAPHRRAAR